MSTAADLLATGFASDQAIWGESLGYIPASVVQRMEHGEAVTTEQGKAIINDETTTTITGQWRGTYFTLDAMGAAVATNMFSVLVPAIAGVERGAIIVKDSVHYNVTEAETPEVDGSQLLILSKHAH